MKDLEPFPSKGWRTAEAFVSGSTNSSHQVTETGQSLTCGWNPQTYICTYASSTMSWHSGAETKDIKNGKQSRDESKNKQFSIQPHPIHLSTLKICRVELCTELFYAIIPTLFLCVC